MRKFIIHLVCLGKAKINERTVCKQKRCMQRLVLCRDMLRIF
ncbi:hypothetical protein TcasGA2_TC034724 [Tribolium castaneum]|uniref:Uncharacterized protein n=1 Tax=Tribolium castaneum TaxID=7070 RepID=A0A139WGI5_TRICA|nr:hypothetical protein TcasGA2_TC034724 [Tribolium castaneum]